MPELQIKRPKTKLLPVIILPNIAFLPVPLMMHYKVKTVADYLALRHVAKGEITSIHQMDYFSGPIILIPAKIQPNVGKMVLGSQESYSGAAVLARIKECEKKSDNVNDIEYTVTIYQKVRIRNLIGINQMHFAEIETIDLSDTNLINAQEIRTSIISILNQLLPFECFSNEKLIQRTCEITDPTIFADLMIHYFNKRLFKEAGEIFSDEELSLYFNELDTIKKLMALLKKMSIRLASEQAKLETNEKVKAATSDMQRKWVLRQQAEALQNELEEIQNKNQMPIDEEFKARIKAAKMSEEAEKMAWKQLERLKMIPHNSPEYAMTMTYLDWLCDLPWFVRTEENIDIIEARQIFNRGHYGLEKIKRRLIEHLAILKLRPRKKPPILCIIGPPGVGKTSLSQAVGEAMGRVTVRISLGGVKDDSLIRGHRRTYVGALPGKILQAMKKAGVKNPVMVIDEIDKLGRDEVHGDPGAALLEVFDSEQNNDFSDHYLEVGYDLSEVLFICTANYEDTIPPTLKDRMQVIRLPGYTPQEKYEIAKQFLIPKQMKENGVEKKGLKITDGALYEIVGNYTQEAGVRNLEREIASVIRNRAVLIAQNKKFKPEIWASDLLEILGPQRFEIAGGVDVHEPGIVTGLAWTAFGGVTLIIESCKMKKIGNEADLKYTGLLGDVMKESIEVAWKIACKYLTEHGVDLSFLKDTRVHLHMPEGAVRKDGPSAGAAMTMALISLLSGRLVRRDLAMTGEITFRDGGTILPVGGIKEKLLAAHQAGYKYAFIPSRNEKDLPEVPEDVKRDMEIRLASNIKEVIEFALL